MSSRATLSATALAVLLAACHPQRAPQYADASPAHGHVITAAQIERSHAVNAWDVLRQSGEFRMEENADGDPVRLQSRRGRSSLFLHDADTPLIVVDGARISDVTVLREIGAGSIALVRILNGRDGTTYYGTNSGGGVVIITTKSGSDGPPQ